MEESRFNVFNILSKFCELIVIEKYLFMAESSIKLYISKGKF